MITHSLTAALDHLRVRRSVLHIERSWHAIHAAPTDRPISSSTCCSQFLRGRPGGRFQSAAGGVTVWASIDSWSALTVIQLWIFYINICCFFYQISFSVLQWHRLVQVWSNLWMSLISTLHKTETFTVTDDKKCSLWCFNGDIVQLKQRYQNY